MTETLPDWYIQQTSPEYIPHDKALTGVANPDGFGNSLRTPGSSGSRANSRQPHVTLDKNQKSMDELKVKKAWEVAFAPAKSLPMNIFVSYMSGNSLQLIPLMMTLMMFFVQPMKSIAGSGGQFTKFQTPQNYTDVSMARWGFVAAQALSLAVGVWKLGQMGLLPNKASDWLAWETVGGTLESFLK
ncbi:DUF1077-domain-containing protein [Nadsonia fulvescens var. elongata DSM 6958]|uniref:ER membrane protein complex subunit 4 n=1 Tax=Nadsonia fulvescens var. elongata DSM 6958 TaxID=857566 RepID=A0A1E3PJG4_9ASCO|nr:DUF1077-domain-containing protein [Nadsonia fulvescens var. elongata DSM 6958]